jgi:pimeloyl-ACP methyl ester carboxylesterase
MGKVISTLLFQPPDEPTHLSSKKYFWLTTSRGVKIPAFYIQQHHARYTILYSHGNAEDLGMIYDYLSELSELLYINVFAYDYSGYGLGSRRKDNIENKVEPSEDNCYADIEAAYKHLTEVELVCPTRIVLYGRSVGSGPSCYLAQKLNKDRGDHLAGLILHSPFLSVCRVVIDMGFEMSYDVFPNVSRMKEIGCPTYIMHGTNDEIVPFRHGEGLHNALPENIRYPPFWAEKMGHNNIELQMTSVFIKRLQKFFLHIRKLQEKQGKPKDSTKVGNYNTLDKQFGVTFSGDTLPVVTDSEDSESITVTSSTSSTSRNKGRRFGKLGKKKQKEVDDEDRSPSSSEKLRKTVTFYRTLAPITREGIECMMNKSRATGV